MADPSVCAVGEGYYLVNSSFECFPGIPLFHSKNLVDWKQIGHVLTRETQLQLKRKHSFTTSQGIYAPTIRYHKGGFTDVYFGLYATGSSKHSTTPAHFDYFKYEIIL